MDSTIVSILLMVGGMALAATTREVWAGKPGEPSWWVKLFTTAAGARWASGIVMFLAGLHVLTRHGM